MLRVLPRSEVDGSAKGHNAGAESRILRRNAAPVKKSQNPFFFKFPSSFVFVQSVLCPNLTATPSLID